MTRHDVLSFFISLFLSLFLSLSFSVVCSQRLFATSSIFLHFSNCRLCLFCAVAYCRVSLSHTRSTKVVVMLSVGQVRDRCWICLILHSRTVLYLSICLSISLSLYLSVVFGLRKYTSRYASCLHGQHRWTDSFHEINVRC